MKQKRTWSVESEADNLDIRQEITKLQKKNAELVLKNQTLEKKLNSLNKPLDETRNFFNNISHEVRTPIQGINAIAKGLVSNWYNFDNKTNYELASKIAQNSQRLFSLIDNILELSKLKNGKIDLKFHKVNLQNLINEMVDECHTLYLNEKNITINIISKISPDINLLIDEDKITQVLRNLLSNAIKITPSGTITIEIKENKSFIVVSIIDEGTGISEIEAKTLFTQSFNNNSGAGIGLFVSNAIIKAHGGKICAENNLDKGAKFSFTLPLPSSSTSQSSMDHSPYKANDPKIEEENSSANIVVIDDEETCLLSLSMMLHKTNYILHKFSSPIKALEFLDTNPKSIDLILLDMMMPELHGLEVLKKIKSYEMLKNIPVIMQSGVADIDQIDLALSLGVKDFIRKPYTSQILITSIENIIKSTRKK